MGQFNELIKQISALLAETDVPPETKLIAEVCVSYAMDVESRLQALERKAGEARPTVRLQ